MLTLCDEQTSIFVVSDHGMNEIERFFYVHNWLEGEGFLRFHDDLPEIQFAQIFAEILRFDEGAFDKTVRTDILSSLLNVRNGMTSDERHTLGRAFTRRWPGYRVAHDNIDWSRTKIFTTTPFGLFYVNVAGVHPDGCVNPGGEYDALVEEFIARLMAVRDPYTKQPLVRRAYRGDQYYKRFKLGLCPDVVIEKADHQCYINPLYQHYLKVDQYFARRHDMDPRFAPAHFGYIGDHTPYGMLVAAGPGIRQGGSVNMVDIVDIAPTIMSLFDVPVPKDMDGRVLKELFREAVHVRETDSSMLDPITTERLMEEEAELIRQTLRKLGYKL